MYTARLARKRPMGRRKEGEIFALALLIWYIISRTYSTDLNISCQDYDSVK